MGGVEVCNSNRETIKVCALFALHSVIELKAGATLTGMSTVVLSELEPRAKVFKGSPLRCRSRVKSVPAIQVSELVVLILRVACGHIHALVLSRWSTCWVAVRYGTGTRPAPR